MFNFVFDCCVNNEPYPNLAPRGDSFEHLGDTYPWIGPLRLLYYTKDHNYPVNISYINQPIPDNAFYPVGICWFDFDIDYFDLMSSKVLDLLRSSKLKVLFYYHEGDSPWYEKERLDELCQTHKLPLNCYVFVSGNSASKHIPGFVYFVDHELFYWRNSVVWNNQEMSGCQAHLNTRHKDFTALSRLHKQWRATVIAQLKYTGLLNNSFWSYNIITQEEHPDTYNPIELWPFDSLEEYIELFLKDAPYTCDTLSEQDHNNHWTLVKEHYEDSYCNLVLETFYDAERSNGAFISEKTFKPIRHGQPFVIFGTPGILQVLKDLGYRTFDEFIDNSYDAEINNTKRFEKTLTTVSKLHKQDLHKWYASCYDGCLYNQKLFTASKYNRLDQLAADLNTI